MKKVTTVLLNITLTNLSIHFDFEHIVTTRQDSIRLYGTIYSNVEIRVGDNNLEQHCLFEKGKKNKKKFNHI